MTDRTPAAPGLCGGCSLRSRFADGTELAWLSLAVTGAARARSWWQPCSFSTAQRLKRNFMQKPRFPKRTRARRHWLRFREGQSPVRNWRRNMASSSGLSTWLRSGRRTSPKSKWTQRPGRSCQARLKRLTRNGGKPLRKRKGVRLTKPQPKETGRRRVGRIAGPLTLVGRENLLNAGRQRVQERAARQVRLFLA